MNELTILLAAFGVFAVAIPASVFYGRRLGRASEVRRQTQAKATAEETQQRILAEAEREADRVKKAAVVAGKEDLIKLRESFETDVRGRREEVEREERRISERETMLD